MDLSKNNHFSTQETTNYIPCIEKGKKVPISKMLWVFVLLNASNFVMETEKNSTQRQVYDSYTI